MYQAATSIYQGYFLGMDFLLFFLEIPNSEFFTRQSKKSQKHIYIIRIWEDNPQLMRASSTTTRMRIYQTRLYKNQVQFEPAI